MYEDDLQLGKLKENCFQALSQTHKNVSEPQTGIERLERLTGDQKVAGSIPVWASETFF